jgi:hypothetical protein
MVAARKPYAIPRMAKMMTKTTTSAKHASMEAGKQSKIPHP